MVTKITVSYGGTINLGNFENVKVEYSLEFIPEVSPFQVIQMVGWIDLLRGEFEEEKRKLLTKKGN